VIVAVDDPDDPRIEGYRAVRERDLAGRDGLFVIEGRVVLEKAVAACPGQIASVLVAEARLGGLSAVLARLPDSTPVYVAGQGAMDAIVGFPIHRGILALGRRVERSARSLLAELPERALVPVLVGIANHDNMGGLFRNAAAFGASAVLIDATSCDPLYRKAIRVSVGGALVMPFARLAPDEDVIALLEEFGLAPIALSPRGSVELSDLRFSARTAAFFGAEGVGLPDALINCMQSVHIAMGGGFDSLNVATSSGIVLHAWIAGEKSRAL
jgi:tRNA G18 (ribose-2'-O)-methylase SpoU